MKQTIAVLILLCAFGCGASQPPPNTDLIQQMPIREFGIQASVTLKTGPVVKGELIAVTDTSVWCLAHSLGEYGSQSIASVELDTSFARPWIFEVVLFMGLPSVGLLAADAGVGAVGLMATALTYLGFESSVPKKLFANPTTPQERSVLRHYARFPYGIPPGFAQTQP